MCTVLGDTGVICMARRRGRSSRGQRDTFDIARPLDRLLTPISRPSRLISPDLSPMPDLFDDRRQWHPDSPYQAPMSLLGPLPAVVIEAPARPGRRPRGSASGSPYRYPVFSTPSKVAVCVRRKDRREVLFAKKRTGKGSRSFRRRRNYQSDVRC